MKLILVSEISISINLLFNLLHILSSGLGTTMNLEIKIIQNGFALEENPTGVSTQ